ncbi:uncharacterized protein YtpQ (UPF0354 family) [Bacillus velezensis]|nr:uncharacterized protein YtpQ (UPF0354 family) [Bacillus velezensis]
MKMTSRKLADLLKQRLQHENRSFFFDREKDTLRVEDQTTKKGITLELPPIIAKWETKKEEAIDEIVYYVSEAMEAMEGSGQEMSGKEAGIYPVIRSTSFPDQTSDGIPLVYDDHTAETRIYYALDLGKTYRLIDSAYARERKLDKRTDQGDGVIQSPLSSFSCETGYGCGQLFLFFQGE